MNERSFDKPLLVDLDGSLINSDTLYENAILLLKNKPWLVFKLIYWAALGKQVLKGRLYNTVSLNIEALPYRDDVISYLFEEKSRGRSIILCTGCWHALAQKIGDKIGIFDEIIATTESVNLTGKNKAELALSKYGEKGFSYLGNEYKDIHIWRHAESAILVGPESLEKQVEPISPIEKSLPQPKLNLKKILKAIRIHQWSKNALLFVPLLMAHKFTEVESVVSVIFAFLAFGLCASSTYLLNDLLDLEADRNHHTKKKRPLASGVLSIPQGIVLCAGLMTLGVIIALTINILFLVTLAGYLILTILYSFKLKQLQTVDVISLASLFTIRVIAGGAAAEVYLTFWLLSFSMFLFLSLAIVKRVSELINTSRTSSGEDKKIQGRGYFYSDLVILECLGASAGFLAVLVMAFYINSDDVVNLYKYPQVLWLICPIIGYWIMRIWMLTARGQMNEDPISFAITDRNSWYAGACLLAILITAGML